MNLPSLLGNHGPGLRAAVLSMAAGLVVLAAILVSTSVSDHVAETATTEAVRSTEAVVRAYIDPLVAGGALVSPSADQSESVNAQLSRLVASRQILRIKIWAPDGTILYSDLPALRGQQFDVDNDLSEALNGETATDYSDASDAENIFERGLASHFLSIYLPIAGPSGSVVGAYEIYKDATPIELQIAATRQDVLAIVGLMAICLLVLLWVAFSAASRLLARQNRQLRERATNEQFLTTDLRRSEERFRSLVQNAADVIMVIRADGTIAFESPAVERVLGYRVADRLDRQALGFIHPEDVEAERQLLADVSRVPGAQLSGEFRTRHANGSWRSTEVVAKNLLDDAAVRGIVVNYRDITDRRALERELEHRAFHDSLTGLANRALFADRLSHALLRRPRSRHPLAVLFLDLDDFKTVNDSLGHNEGDQLLVAVAERLRNALRASDTIARMGGDEFAILVEDPPDALAPADVAKRLLTALDTPFTLGAKELHVRASIGIAISKSTLQTAEELLRNADVSMYTAKRAGKNRVETFEPAMHSAVLARLALKVDLERALERHEFTIQYQPIFDLASRAISGAEALVRWQHPDRGQVEPLDFIPVAEETGLIVPLGAWVLEEACSQVVRWNRVERRQARDDERERLGATGAGGGLRRGSRANPGEDRTGCPAAAARVHGERPHAGHVVDERDPLRAQEARRAAGHRRLRDGLFIPELPAPVPDRRAEDRPVLRRRERQRARAGGGGPLDRAARRDAPPRDGRRRDRGGRPAGQRSDLGANLGQGFFLARPLSADAVVALLQGEGEGLDPVAAAKAAGVAGAAAAAGAAAVRGPFAAYPDAFAPGA